MEPNAPVCGTHSIGPRPTEETEANSAVSCEKCMELREGERHRLRQDAHKLQQRARKLRAGARKGERALKPARNRHSLKARNEKWTIELMWEAAGKKEGIAAQLLRKAERLDHFDWLICPDCQDKRRTQQGERFTPKDARPSDWLPRRKGRVRFFY